MYGHRNIELLRPSSMAFSSALNASLNIAQVSRETLDERWSEKAKEYC